MLYELISTGNGSSITLLHRGRVYTATNTHPAFALIIEGLSRVTKMSQNSLMSNSLPRKPLTRYLTVSLFVTATCM